MLVTNDKIIYVDVDWTLLIPSEDDLIIPDSPNVPLVEKIKEWYKDGYTIVVWTSNSRGVVRAEEAVILCQLEDYVDFCLPKPYKIVDDDHLEYYSTIDPVTLKWR